jgi:hypothetical protein
MKIKREHFALNVQEKCGFRNVSSNNELLYFSTEIQSVGHCEGEAVVLYWV